MLHKGVDHDISFDTRMFAGVFQFAYLRVGLYFGCVILFTNLFRGEVLNRTLHYYFLAPIRRDVLAAGKFLSALVASVCLFGASVIAAYLTVFMHFGPSSKISCSVGRIVSPRWYALITVWLA
jgi:ABC-type transport system involved in multi-copper enzyme maturation permease subunit